MPLLPGGIPWLPQLELLSPTTHSIVPYLYLSDGQCHLWPYHSNLCPQICHEVLEGRVLVPSTSEGPMSPIYHLCLLMLVLRIDMWTNELQKWLILGNENTCTLLLQKCYTPGLRKGWREDFNLLWPQRLDAFGECLSMASPLSCSSKLPPLPDPSVVLQCTRWSTSALAIKTDASLQSPAQEEGQAVISPFCA